MERRYFLKGLLGIGAAVVAGSALLATPAEALPVIGAPDAAPKDPATAEFNPDRDGVPTPENAQFYYRRRRRRRFYGRRRVWRRRRFYGRRRFRRRVIFL